jgi:hypothetical protein
LGINCSHPGRQEVMKAKIQPSCFT